TTTFTYDANGNLRTVQDPQNNDVDTKYTYDGLNRKIEAEYLLGLDEQFTYDGDNNLIGSINRRGIVFTNEYDNLNRILKMNIVESISNGGNLLNLERYVYDDTAHKTSIFDGKNNRTEQQFDGLDRIVLITDPYDKTIASTYDGVNKRTEVDKKLQR